MQLALGKECLLLLDYINSQMCCPVSRKAETSFCDQFLGLYFSINFWALLYSVYLLVMQEEMERNFKVSWEIHLEMIYIYIKICIWMELLFMHILKWNSDLFSWISAPRLNYRCFFSFKKTSYNLFIWYKPF